MRCILLSKLSYRSLKDKINYVVSNYRARTAVDAFKNNVLQVTRSEWQEWYEKRFHRMKKCIDHCGEYFERQ